MSKKSRFRGPFDKEHGKRAETLLKSVWHHVYHIYWCLGMKWRLKKSLWVICKILGLFVNLLTADNKYSVLNRENLLQEFQMQLSQKPKIFSEVFFEFFEFRFNFAHFEKKDDPQSWCIFKLTECQKRG